eukprot:m.489337 g.489337  ORF g.489337 m.489337 type:complete len:454 (-) comp26612_c0_seq1:251-1612(-)
MRRQSSMELPLITSHKPSSTGTPRRDANDSPAGRLLRWCRVIVFVAVLVSAAVVVGIGAHRLCGGGSDGAVPVSRNAGDRPRATHLVRECPLPTTCGPPPLGSVPELDIGATPSAPVVGGRVLQRLVQLGQPGVLRGALSVAGPWDDPSLMRNFAAGRSCDPRAHVGCVSVTNQQETVEMALGLFLDTYQAQGLTMAHPLRCLGPQLGSPLRDVLLPPMLCPLMQARGTAGHLLFSNGDTGRVGPGASDVSALQHDQVILQLQGTRDFWFAPLNQTTVEGLYMWERQPLNKPLLSPVVRDSPDYSLFPGYAEVESVWQHVQLKAGDAMLIPAWWAHSSHASARSVAAALSFSARGSRPARSSSGNNNSNNGDAQASDALSCRLAAHCRAIEEQRTGLNHPDDVLNLLQAGSAEAMSQLPAAGCEAAAPRSLHELLRKTPALRRDSNCMDLFGL